MQAYPGRPNPVLAALTGEISIRTLRVMLEHLPIDNPARRELTGVPWDDRTILAHDAANSLRAGLTQTENLYRKKGQPPSKPELIPRPWEQDTTEPEQDPERVQAERAHLQAVLARNRRPPELTP